MTCDEILERYSDLEMKATDTNEWVKMTEIYPNCYPGRLMDSTQETVILDSEYISGFVFRAKIENGYLYMHLDGEKPSSFDPYFNGWGCVTEIRLAKEV